MEKERVSGIAPRFISAQTPIDGFLFPPSRGVKLLGANCW
jgi:hypothetical protein